MWKRGGSYITDYGEGYGMGVRIQGTVGLRCLAQALIVAYHQFKPLDAHKHFNLASGQVCVSFFFILSGLTAGISLTQRRIRHDLYTRPWLYLRDHLSFVLRRTVALILCICLLLPFYGATPANVPRPGYDVANDPFFNTWNVFWSRTTALYLPNTTLWFISNLLLYWNLAPLAAALLRYLPLHYSWVCGVFLLAIDQSLWWLMPAPGPNWKTWESLYISPLTHAFQFMSGLAFGVNLSRLALKHAIDDQSTYLWEGGDEVPTKKPVGDGWRLAPQSETDAQSDTTPRTEAPPDGFLPQARGDFSPPPPCESPIIVVDPTKNGAAAAPTKKKWYASIKWRWWWTDCLFLMSTLYGIWLLGRNPKRSLRRGFPQADWRFGSDIPILLFLIALTRKGSQDSMVSKFFNARWFRKCSPEALPVVVYIIHWNWNSMFIGAIHDSPHALLCCCTLYPAALLFARLVYVPLNRIVSNLCQICLS